MISFLYVERPVRHKTLIKLVGLSKVLSNFSSVQVLSQYLLHPYSPELNLEVIYGCQEPTYVTPELLHFSLNLTMPVERWSAVAFT